MRDFRHADAGLLGEAPHRFDQPVLVRAFGAVDHLRACRPLGHRLGDQQRDERAAEADDGREHQQRADVEALRVSQRWRRARSNRQHQHDCKVGDQEQYDAFHLVQFAFSESGLQAMTVLSGSILRVRTGYHPRSRRTFRHHPRVQAGFDDSIRSSATPLSRSCSRSPRGAVALPAGCRAFAYSRRRFRCCSALDTIFFSHSRVWKRPSIHLRPLLQVLARDLRELPEEGDAMPLGLLLLFAGALVLPRFRGRDRDVGDRAALGHVARLGIAPEVADDDHPVDGCHELLLC